MVAVDFLEEGVNKDHFVVTIIIIATNRNVEEVKISGVSLIQIRTVKKSLIFFFQTLAISEVVVEAVTISVEGVKNPSKISAIKEAPNRHQITPHSKIEAVEGLL